MTHKVEGSSSSQRVELEAWNPFIVNGKKIPMTKENMKIVLRLLLEEKLRREIVGMVRKEMMDKEEKERKIRREEEDKKRIEEEVNEGEVKEEIREIDVSSLIVEIEFARWPRNLKEDRESSNWDSQN
uniref:Uncharacterized protein n=1 Tax=Cucumis melo TaxID=3656 RepID=A0A9I9DIS4_CUCME